MTSWRATGRADQEAARWHTATGLREPEKVCLVYAALQLHETEEAPTEYRMWVSQLRSKTMEPSDSPERRVMQVGIQIGEGSGL